jgi:lysophospholipase L1-like esterase
MKTKLSVARAAFVACVVILALAAVAQAQPWVSFGTHSRYVALGDSISAGFGAIPATQGFPYLLYESGVIDSLTNTLFCNMAVPGAVTKDVLDYQVPQIKRFLKNTGSSYRQVITLQIGGNDLAQILTGADPQTVLSGIGTNLFLILSTLTAQFPEAQIYVANFYDPKLPVTGEKALILALDQVIAATVAAAAAANPSAHLVLVDVYTAFEGRSGLLINEKKGADLYDADLTNAGQRVVAEVFERAIRRHCSQ